MTVEKIYKRLGIPPNLQRHMLLVTKIALFICKHWKGGEINPQELKKLCLLHDVGNIVKFQIKQYPQYLEEEQERADYWIGRQSQTIAKYGSDDNIATSKMLQELGINSELIQLIKDKEYGNTIAIKDGTNWTLKVMLYSDLRVAPTGLQSLENRLTEVMNRYEKYRKRHDLFEASKEIEKQLQERVDISLSGIDETNIEANNQELLETEV